MVLAMKQMLIQVLLTAKEEKVAKHLMSASRILWRLKQSLATAMCLKHGQKSQETISTFLWDNGAVM